MTSQGLLLLLGDQIEVLLLCPLRKVLLLVHQLRNDVHFLKQLIVFQLLAYLKHQGVRQRDVQSQVEVDELWIKSELFTKIEGPICSNHIVVEIQFFQRPLLVGQVSDAVRQHLGTFILDLVVI